MSKRCRVVRNGYDNRKKEDLDFVKGISLKRITIPNAKNIISF